MRVFGSCPVAILGCLLVLFGFSGSPAQGAGNREAAIAQMRMAFDLPTIRKGLSEIRYFKEAGFIYQPALSVPQSGTCSVKEDWDQRAVMSGMVAADRSFAFLYGTYADVQRETKRLRNLLPELPKQAVSQADMKVLQEGRDTLKGREILAQRTYAILNDMLNMAAKNEHNLRVLGAHLYGDLVERFYLAGIMALAAAESDSDAPLRKIQVDSGSRMVRVLQSLSREGMLGDSSQQKERGRKLGEMVQLISVNNYHPPLGNLKKLVKLCRDERNLYMIPGDWR